MDGRPSSPAGLSLKRAPASNPRLAKLQAAHDRTQLYGTVRIPTNKPTQIAPRNEDTAKSTGSRMAFMSRDLSAKQAMAILSSGQYHTQSGDTG